MNPLKRSPAVPSPENAADLFARLQRHPQLYAQMAALLDEVENRAGALNTGDEAEDAIVARMREFGRQAAERVGRAAAHRGAAGAHARPAASG